MGTNGDKWGQAPGDANANGDRPQAKDLPRRGHGRLTFAPKNCSLAILEHVGTDPGTREHLGTDPESESRKYSIEFVAWKTEFLDKIKILYYFHNCNEYKNIYYVIDYSLLKTLFL